MIDGAIADSKTIENGIVTFEWKATAVPINIHTICVAVNASMNCKSPGQDCKKIIVSSSVLGITEQLERERSSASEQRRLLEQARLKTRSDIIEAELEIPTPYVPYIPPVTAPITPTTPTEPTTPPVTEPIIDYGNISIIGLPAIIIPITSNIPIYLYIDNKSIGRIYEIPKTVTNVAAGTHQIYATAGAITTPTKTVIVRKDETTNIIL
jgi:hypothetical protein